MGNSFVLSSRGFGWRSTFTRPGRNFDFDDFGRFGFGRFGYGGFGLGLGFGPAWPWWNWNWWSPSIGYWDPFWFTPWYQPWWGPYSYDSPSTGTDSSNDYDLSYSNPSDQSFPNSNSDPSAQDQGERASPSPNASPVLELYLTDGTMIPVTDYWLAGNMLHYLLPNGTEVAISLSQVDLQRTVDENAKREIEFIMRPGPASSNKPPGAQSSPAATGSSSDQSTALVNQE